MVSATQPIRIEGMEEPGTTLINVNHCLYLIYTNRQDEIKQINNFFKKLLVVCQE
jgi:hypothetical protein